MLEIIEIVGGILSIIALIGAFTVKFFKKNVIKPLKEIKDNVSIMKFDVCVTTDYLMERNGYADYRKNRIEQEISDKRLCNLIKGSNE